MSELLNLMTTRRSVRRFRAEAPPREVLELLVAAAVTAPSASNRQPWRFVIVRSAERIAALAAAVRQEVDLIARHIDPASEAPFRAYGDYFTRFCGAPVVIAVLFHDSPVLSHLAQGSLPLESRGRVRAMERDSGLIGAALALQNLLLRAHELGLGASGMTGPLVAEDRLRALLEVPPSWGIAALVPVGYPDEQAAAPERKAPARVTRWID